MFLEQELYLEENTQKLIDGFKDLVESKNLITIKKFIKFMASFYLQFGIIIWNG